ncbi:putative chemosensory receptor 4 [Danaus plexippus plexippus]|uniref:Chemosensory receptor 4 n=1 Tax=Danaus plexippus plexippus TaxID=278856 RepID=A0A212FM45_DANPL|nr:putative chemosensory receptor 4 [Danaus plexippus plexippus]
MRVREPLPKCEANGTILTMLRFCRVFSLAPLRFTRVRNGVYRITTSRVLFIFSTPLPIIINALMILLYRSILQTEIQRVNFAFAFVKILLLVVVGAPDVLTTSLAILKGQGRMRNLMSVLNQIQKIRRRIGYDYSLDPSTLKIILIMVGPFILNMSLHVLGLYVDDVVDGISNNESIKPIKFFIYELLWMINHIADILLLIEPFHRMNREMEHTKIVMSKLLNTMSHNTALYYELDNFYQQFTLNLQGLTPLGLCHLNRPLIATIVGFLVTFLSIMNQFKFYEGM